MEEQIWIFTFGCGQKHGGHYVKIKGTFSSARAKMIEKFGDKWCWQYSEDEWNKMIADPKRTWKVETQLENNGGIENV